MFPASRDGVEQEGKKKKTGYLGGDAAGWGVRDEGSRHFPLKCKVCVGELRKAESGLFCGGGMTAQGLVGLGSSIWSFKSSVFGKLIGQGCVEWTEGAWAGIEDPG